jgi:hypothetical protein
MNIDFTQHELIEISGIINMARDKAVETTLFWSDQGHDGLAKLMKQEAEILGDIQKKISLVLRKGEN